MRNSSEAIKNTAIIKCRSYLSQFPVGTSGHTNQNLAQECIDQLNELKHVNVESVAMVLVDINEKIVGCRSVAYRYLWKFFNRISLERTEPAGELRAIIENLLYKILNKGKFTLCRNEYDVHVSPMTTRESVNQYFRINQKDTEAVELNEFSFNN